MLKTVFTTVQTLTCLTLKSPQPTTKYIHQRTALLVGDARWQPGLSIAGFRFPVNETPTIIEKLSTATKSTTLYTLSAK